MGRIDKRKKSSVKRKVRRGFHGVRRQEMSNQRRSNEESSSASAGHAPQFCENSLPVSTSGVPEVESISVKKLLNSSFENFEDGNGPLTREKAKKVGLGATPDVELATGFKLQDAVLLSDCISKAAICSSCRKAKSKLQLYQNNAKREGLAESLFLKCSSCGVVTPLATSKKVGGKGGGPNEINRRAVLGSCQMGHAGLSHFCATLGLAKPVAKEAYQKHLRQIEKATMSHADDLMNDAARRLREKVMAERPDDIEGQGEEAIAHVSVTVDGTWQKRGHSSKIGVVFVIAVDTGEILDYAVKSLFCHQCKAHNAWDSNSKEFEQWQKDHKDKCEVNHTGSSEEMEAAGAVEIFTRSITTRKLKYTTFVGDGDSSCFGRVKEALEKKYGSEYEIKKEECVGHVQKRLGTALRKYKKDMKGKKLKDGKTVGGKGRLTDKVIDQMQNYYGKAIRGNKGNLDGMKASIKAIQCHMIKNSQMSLDKQHQYCPKSDDTWCKYWKDKNNNTSLYNEDNRLPEVFMQELDPIFVRLSKDELLSRCLRGVTQNQNESANGVLWSKCPKTKFCGARRVRIAVAKTIAEFNTGAASQAVALELCGVDPGVNTMRALRMQDQERLLVAAKKVSEKYKKRRQELRAQKKDKADKKSYQPGGFGLNSQPDVQIKVAKKKRAPKRKNDSEQFPIKFVLPTLEVVGKKKKQ